MPTPNAGGGRYNQNNHDPNVPRRALFSFSANGGKGKGSGKGDKGGNGEAKGKGKRPVFESQKAMDKWKGQQKGQSAAAAPAAAAPTQGAVPHFWQKTDSPSYVHSVFCLTRDDHMAIEPLLLNPQQKTAGGSAAVEEGLPADVADEASEHLRSLGLLLVRIKPALEVVGPQLVREAAEQEMVVSARAVAERALEWICSVTPERELPSKLREAGEVSACRRRQEERNTAFQTRALLLGGTVDSTHITRIEKLGFSRAKALEALANAPDHDLMAAVKGLLAGYLPLELEPEAESTGAVSSLADLSDEAEALEGAYGTNEVQRFAHSGSFELDIALPGTEWHLAAMFPEGLPYPLVCPLLCPRHPRLREAGRPRLLAALGEVCSGVLGSPMLFALCEWLQNEGERFLVRGAAEEHKVTDTQNSAKQSSAVQRSLEASEDQRLKEGEIARQRAERVNCLKAKIEEESASEPSKLKDKIAIHIRSDPGSMCQHDLAGYDDARIRQLVRDAFSAPLQGDSMVRITFIIGGGKMVRQKYSESLGQTLGIALEELGFKQDSSAALTLESGGTFKGQYDKQRNLKLVHVFPRMTGPKGSARAPEHTVSSEEDHGLYNEYGEAEDAAESSAASPAAQQPRKAGEGVYEVSSGATLTFEAPPQLTEATRLVGAGAAADGAEQSPESDAVWLQSRIEKTKKESDRLQVDFGREKPLNATRQSLPAWSLRDDIQRAVRRQQVVVIEGETGCGKSTQVPQFILEDWVGQGEGGAVNLLMTQPRRLSAIGVAERMATEIDCPLGDVVGYSIRLESKKSVRTKILVCTTGVVLRRLEADRSLRGVTHVVVDECHERDLDTDFLLTVLKEILPSRPALKVVLMSATINAQIFRQYFGNCESVSIPGRTFPVTSYYLEHAVEHTGFCMELDSEYSRKDAEPLQLHETEQLQQLYEQEEYQELVKGSVSTRVLEQMNRMDPERINFDLVAAVVRHIHAKLDPPNRFKTPGAILVFVPGLGEIRRCVRALTDEDPRRPSGQGKVAGGGSSGLWVLPLHSMVGMAEQRLVFRKPERGQRKVVVTTNIAETSITIDDVEYVVDCGRHKQTRYDPQNRVSMLVDCMETKANAKQRRGRAGRVKAGVCYHLVSARKWRRLEDFEKPEMLRVPLDSLCLRISLLNLGHPAKFLAKALTPPNEAAVRSSLQQLVELSAVELQQRRAAVEAADGAEEREDPERLMKAKLRLTPLGAHLAQLPVDACIGKLLVLGCLFGIPGDVCVLAASVSSKDPFQACMGEKRKEMEKQRLALADGFIDGSLESDHLLLVSLFQHWEELGGKSGTARAWCRANNLDAHTFEAVSETRTHLMHVLVEQGFVAKHVADECCQKGGARSNGASMPPCLASIAPAVEEFDRRKRNLLRALLCAALWPNVALRKDGQLFAKHQAVLSFHPASILGLQDALAAEAQANDWNCPQCGFYCFGSREVCPACGGAKPLPGPKKVVRQLRHRAFVYGEKVRSVATPGSQGKKPQVHIKECCGVSVKALFLLGHRVGADYLSGRASVDGWIHCQAAPRDVAMLLGLRRLLQGVLSRLLAGGEPAEVLAGDGLEVIDAATALLVLDVE